MGNGQKALHKIRELTEVALNILSGSGGASWFLRHDTRSVPCRATKVNLGVRYDPQGLESA